MKQIFQIYPRGFIGAGINYVPPQPDSIEDARLKSLQVDNRLFENVRDMYLATDASLLGQVGGENVQAPINPKVEKLYALMMDNAPKAISFDFKEDIIKEALKAFGTHSFREWISIQASSPRVKWTHSEFILQTLKFIETGHRELVHEMWAAMISDNASTNPYETNKIVEELKKPFWRYGLQYESVDYEASQDRVNTVKDILLDQVIIRWCSHANGVYDMLNTLHVLFGN